MKLSPPELKHFILTKYQHNRRGYGFDALAQQYGIAGGGRTVKDWYDRWDGTVDSLKRKPGSGRPRLLSEKEVHQYITAPIRKKNRKFEPVHYRDVLRPLRDKTGKSPSLPTVRRYGKENASINSKRTSKKTEWECKYYIHIHSFITHICIHFGFALIHSAHNLFIL
jgi:transposase